MTSATPANRADRRGMDLRFVADHADDRAILPAAQMRAQPELFDALNHMGDLLVA